MFFTIITLVKNSMPYLKKNIISTNNQIFRNYEHLIIYTRSKDSSLKFIKKNIVNKRKLIFFDTNNQVVRNELVLIWFEKANQTSFTRYNR